MVDEDLLPRAIVGIELSMNATGWETQRPRLIGDPDYAGGVIVSRKPQDMARVVEIFDRLARQINELPQSLAPLICMSPRRPSRLKKIWHGAILEEKLLDWFQQRHMPVLIVEPPVLDRWLAGSRGQQLTGNNLECLIWRRYQVEVQEHKQARALGLVMIGATVIGERKPENPKEERIAAQLRKAHPEVCRVCGVKL